MLVLNYNIVGRAVNTYGLENFAHAFISIYVFAILLLLGWTQVTTEAENIFLGY